MKRLYYFIKNYIFDLLAATLAVTLSWISFSSGLSQSLSFLVSFIAIFISLLFITYLRARGRDFYFIPLNRPEDRNDWMGSGKFEYSRVSKCFQVTQTEPGCIYSKCLNWSDYKYEFEFKLRKTCLGVVFRAVNLSNYVMTQITQTGIRPHVRVSGGWQKWEAKDVNLEFPKHLSFEEWYKCQLICDKDTVNIKVLHKREKILDRDWQLPQGVLIFSFKRDESDSNPANIPFPINLEYGSAGFRNSGEEKALVRNVLIEKI